MTVSVIIPCYNCERTITKTISALLIQTVKPKEIICVDDGSTDYTKREIKKFGKKVKYVHQKNSGPAKARNVGAKKATSEIIVFTDSDCTPIKRWLEEMVKPFKDKKVGGVQGAYLTKQKDLVARCGQIEIEQRYEKMENAKEIDWVGSYSAAFKRKEFINLGGYDESFPIASGEDPEFSFRLAKSKAKLVFNPRATVYHTHPSKLLKYLKIKLFRAVFRPKMYSKHTEKMAKDSYTPQSLKVQIALFYLTLLAAALSIMNIEILQVVGILLLLHVISGLGFFAFAWKKNKVVALLSPIVIFLRSTVFGIGLIWGMIR